jgi:predicted nucleic acid-binding protein
VAAIVISDASPLIGLAQVNGIDWLRELFGTVLLPATVADEVLTGRFTDQEARITAAVIGLARLRGLIPSAREVFDALHNSDFRIAPAVITTVLKRCGEIDDDSAG